MKKLLTFLTLLTLSIGVGWAANTTVTFTFSSFYSSNTVLDGVSIDGTDVSLVFNKRDGGTATQYYTNGEAVRWYGGGTLTVSSATKTISKIVIVFTQTANSISVNNGTYDASSSSNTGTWTGSASSVIFTQSGTSGHCRISSIAVTYSDGGSTVETVATPTFSPAEGTYSSAQNVTISCTTSGATIHYTTDGNTPTTSSPTYSSAIPVSETTTIKAIAVKSGMNNSDVASATYTIETPQPSGPTTFERITSADDLEAGKRYLIVYEGTPAVLGAISNTSTKYGTSVTGSNNFTLSNGVITLTDNTSAEVLTLGGETNEWTFQIGDEYLYWSSGNSLASNSNVSTNSQWRIEFSNGSPSIINLNSYNSDKDRYIKYNTGSPRFACYESGQQAIQLYKEVESTTSDNLYLIGRYMNSQTGDTEDGWELTDGPQFTYSNSAGTYAVDAYFDLADRGYFQFVEGLSTDGNWSTLTGRYYASGSSDVAVDTYDMDGTVPLYFTNSTDYSPGQYAFSVPAGLYTIVVDKANWQIYVTQKAVTMTISPNSATFDNTKNVTLASNLTDLGGKIYYTTDGTTPSATNGTEYTGTITLDATTTIKAIAILNHIQSEVVEKTYTKTPAAPVITPASCTFNEPLTVSITAESGATIYYTTDGSTPTNESTQYTGSFTVSTTTTVKARAYVGEAYSNVAEATYTYSNVTPSTGDFELVTSADQLVAGNEYIIMSYDSSTDYAMGSISNTRGNPVTDFTLTGTLGASGSKVSAGTTVNVLTLGGTTGAWTFKQADDQYITTEKSGTGISTGSACNLVITIGSDYAANIQNSETSDTRQIRYATAGYFRNYGTSQANTNEVYLYTRASNAVQPPVFSPVPGIYNVDIAVTISCATDGATIYYTTDGSEPSAANGTEYTGEMVVSESTTFKAIAIKDNNASSVVTAAYTIQKSTDIETVTLTYSEPFTAGIGSFTINNESGFSPVWSLDGNYGVKGTSYSNGTNHAATSRLISPIIDMTDAVQPELSFSHQINKYFDDVTTQCTVWIRETTDGTSGTWEQIPITFSDPVAAGGWTNDVVDIDLTDINGVSYADKKVQISFLYTNPTAGTGAGTWEIQNFVVADNSEYLMVNNIAEFLALENGTKAKFKNPVTVLYDYAQYSSNSYHEYIWVKDESGYMQFYIIPTLNSDENSGKDGKAAYYENGDIIPAGFVVTKNYYENGKYVQAYSTDALNAGFEQATQKGLADPEFMEFSTLNALDASNDDDVATWCNHYITLEKIKVTSLSKNFNFKDENGTQNACVGYNKYNGDGSLLKDGVTSADVDMSTLDLTKFYNAKGIIQLWQGGWEFMPIEFTEWQAEEVTLRKLCQDGVTTAGQNEYTISNNLLGVYAYHDDDLDADVLWVKDDTGQSIWLAAPDETYKDNFAIEFEALLDDDDNVVIPANTRLEQQYYDQSNWCQLILTSGNGSAFVNKIIKGGSIEGKFTNKTNPTMTGVALVSEGENSAIYADGSYNPNYYIAANFYGNQSCNTDMHGQEGHGDYFFMTPKPQEYATIVWAVWDGQKMSMPSKQDGNSHELEGEFSIDLSMNQYVKSTSGLPAGDYSFHAIIRKAESGSKAADDYMVYPTDLDPDNNPSTAINKVETGNGVVKSVKYVNVAGMVSDTPFQGVNIVVTEYTDGTRTATKMLKK